MASQHYTAAEVVEAIESAEGVVTAAAEALGCSARTIYRYAERYSTVAGALQESRRDLVAEAESAMVSLMRDPTHRDHFKATLRILETYDRRTDWSGRQRLEHSGDMDLHAIDWAALSDEQVSALARGADPAEVL